MQTQVRKMVWPLAGCAALVLSGCALNPAALSPRTTAPPPTEQPPANGMMLPEEELGTMDAAGAERACIAAGQERGLDVLGVVGARDVNTEEAEASRDVMLRVRRDGSEIEVRCNYVASTGMARIMLI